ncbi:MAG: hypothetical protein IJY17_02755 [Alphaproteobacteria bacterium]|nr:hypothetical protein [Alphaproteobacteria bacterium]
MKKIVFLFFILLAGCAIVDPSAEVSRTLNQMNQAYKDKNIEQFMHFVSPEYDGKRDLLQIAVENDFAGFSDVDYRTSVFQTLIDPQTGVYRASVYYFRSAKSPRYGIDNLSGETMLTFVKDEDGLKLIKMPDPGLYGLIVP